MTAWCFDKDGLVGLAWRAVSIYNFVNSHDSASSFFSIYLRDFEEFDVEISDKRTHNAG